MASSSSAASSSSQPRCAKRRSAAGGACSGAPDQQACGSPSAADLLRMLGSDDWRACSAAASMLQSLRAEGSLLSGMFESFLADAAAGFLGEQQQRRQQQRQQQGTTPARPHPQPPQQPAQQAHARASAHAPPSPRRGAGGNSSSSSDSGGGSHKRGRDTQLALELSLEELYAGTTKQVPVAVSRQGCGGAPAPPPQLLSVRVQPGLRPGAHIRLPGLGGEGALGEASELTIEVRQQLHPTFRRLADDLYARVSVPLVTALTGGSVQLRHVSGRVLQLGGNGEVIPAGSELLLRGLGMPRCADAAGRRGDLHVKWDVSFPTRLSAMQQLQLRAALAGCEFSCGPVRAPVLAPCWAPQLSEQEAPDDQAQPQQRQPAPACGAAGIGGTGSSGSAARSCTGLGAAAGASSAGSGASTVGGFASAFSTGTSSAHQ